MPTTGAATAAELPEEESGAFAAPPDTHRLSVGGHPVIYSQRRQQIFQLNDTADLIWRGLGAGDPLGRVADALCRLGVDHVQARRFVDEAVRSWILAGHLLPTAVSRKRQAAPAAVRTLGLDELAVELVLQDQSAAEACDAVFGQLYGPIGRPGRRVEVVAHDGLVFLFLDGEPAGAATADGLAAQVKALLTELYVNGVEGAFLAHGALLARNGRTLFLSGQPGAGKTTLTLALAADGWAYGGDDIVRVDPEGRVRAAPFAAAVKSGAWDLVRTRWPEIDRLPTWVRGDEQRVRYLLPPERMDRSPRPLDAIVLLDRRDGAATELRPAAPLEALSEILDSAYAARWRLDAAALAALARRVEAAACRRLVYADLDEAVAALGDLTACPG